MSGRGDGRRRDGRRGGGGGGRRAPRPTARDAALSVLVSVAEDDAYANLLLPHRIEEARLSAADAALATELAYGALRMSGYYDAIIGIVAKRPAEQVDPLARSALQLGIHQLLNMRVSTHAAVNETVSAVRNRGGQGAAGFVNANLRRVSEAEPEEWRERVAATQPDALARLALLTAHPLWIARALRDALRLGAGAPSQDDTAELERALEADNRSPEVRLAALPGLADRRETVAAHPDRLREDPASPVAMRLAEGDPVELEEVRSGAVRVQDAGSQLVALALSRCAPLRPGERVLDLCAGPGGKSALLAAESRLAGAEFEANEVVPARARLVRRALEPLSGPDGLRVTELDGREFAERPEAYDRILVDAPCTGLGALRRRPEARWRKRPEDVGTLTRLQEELLEAALVALAPGGALVYATCSPHPAETVGVVRTVLRTGLSAEGIEVLDAAVVCDALAPELDLPSTGAVDLAGGRAVQLWSHRHGTDAMFIALLRRRPAAEAVETDHTPASEPDTRSADR
ncbi:RsmB/NOP family class I SAM-dependent RNA methyltransferase [Gulosibacter sp. 10]|uniref:RsmB/NOP family class I SAM-dependent RNA methyltransferase n=1 Tax=Gulosibacter sp. 10 TaxID=1255570 RepID=UPI00097EB9C5|nr:transcription antitermination factor NusB [Gulosibacter sp. 10]SJM53638.1 Ribosomal RNA small subunit methyltransferase B [Gulosibacter sp. 10]